MAAQDDRQWCDGQRRDRWTAVTTKAVAVAACDGGGGGVRRRRAALLRDKGWHVEGGDENMPKICPDINLQNVGGVFCKFVFL